jgi:uncharacterized membrane protein
MLLSTLIGAYGALFFKKAANSFKKGILGILGSKELWLGGVLYGLAFILGMIPLKKEALSLIYPLSAMTYIWVIFISKKHLGEKITKYKIIGILLVVAGIFLVTR